MTWVRLEDSFPDHERVAPLSVAAKWLYICGLLWCSRHLSDGRLPDPEIVNRLAGLKEAELPGAVAELVAAKLWKQSKRGMRVDNYTKRQRTRAEVEAERIATRERVRKFREKQRERNASGNGVSNGGQSTAENIDTPPTPPRGFRGSEIARCERCGTPKTDPPTECCAEVLELKSREA